MKKLLLVVLLASIAKIGCFAEPLVIYSHWPTASEPSVCPVITVRTVSGLKLKTFKLNNCQQDMRKMYVAIHYEQDLIFATDTNRVIKIHLLDEKGNRKISGTGELFTNRSVDHFESVMKDVPSSFNGSALRISVTGLMVDSTANKLVVTTTDFRSLFEMNLDGSNLREVVRENPFPWIPRFSSLWYVTHQMNKLLFRNSETIYILNITRTSDGDKENNTTVKLVSARKVGKYNSIAMDGNKINRMFYTVGHQIRVVEFTNNTLSHQFTPIEELPLSMRIVASRGYETYGAKVLAVTGKYLVWTARSLYVGRLNEQKDYVAAKDMIVLDHDIPVDLKVFEHNSRNNSRNNSTIVNAGGCSCTIHFWYATLTVIVFIFFEVAVI